MSEGKRWVSRAASAQGRSVSSSFKEVIPLKALRQRTCSSGDNMMLRNLVPLVIS